MIGWKIMRVDPDTNELVSGANASLRFPMTAGSKMSMPDPGIWMSLCPQYVEDYYRAHDHEALVRLEFSPMDILAGNLTDAQTEFAVPEAHLTEITLLPAL